ncbi:MAG: hypothetical protein WD645_02360 [Dehalococcoidia bacterium]
MRLMTIADFDAMVRSKEFEKARKLMDKALSVYGKPTMSREELRRRFAEELPADFSLSEFLIKEREAGW